MLATFYVLNHNKNLQHDQVVYKYYYKMKERDILTPHTFKEFLINQKGVKNERVYHLSDGDNEVYHRR